MIDADIQPNYVRVTAKQKIFQLALDQEIRTSDSTIQRSQTTGHLLIIMPKLHFSIEHANVGNAFSSTLKSGKYRQSTCLFYEILHMRDIEVVNLLI